MTVYAITDTKKGRTGIAPTYLQTTHFIFCFNKVSAKMLVNWWSCHINCYAFAAELPATSHRFTDNSLTNQLADSQLADKTTRWQTNSLTRQLADNQLADSSFTGHSTDVRIDVNYR